MKRMLALLTALVMLFAAGACAAEATETPEEVTLDSYSYSIYYAEDIILAGDYCLGAGKDPEWVKGEMQARADLLDVPVSYRWMCENIAAKANPDYEKIRGLLGEENYRTLEVYDRGTYQVDSDYSFNPNREIECSEQMSALLKDDGAEFSFPAAYWYADEFQSVLGTAFSSFKPSRPRPGYVCVVIRSGAESFPGRAWNDEEYGYELRRNMGNVIEALLQCSGEAMPQFTGNPNLASEFWVYDQRYPLHGYYGEDGRIKGYDVEAYLTILKANTREVIDEWSNKATLGDSVYGEYEIATADFPYATTESGALPRIGKKIINEIRKERAALAEGRVFHDSNGQQMANFLLTKMAMETKDPWIRAILERGCVESSMNEDRHELSLFMDGYNSRLEEVLAEGFYDENGNGVYYNWLFRAMENALDYNLIRELVVEDGEITPKSMEKLWSAVGEAGESAKADFARPEMLEAIRRTLWAAPVEGEVTDPVQLLEADFYMETGMDISMTQLAILMYAMDVGPVSTENGPNDITIKFSGADPQKMIETASQKVLDRLGKQTAEERYAERGLEEQFLLELAEYAMGAKGKAEWSATAHTDVSTLYQGTKPEEFLDYLSLYNVNAAMDSLRTKAESLPDEPTVPMPANGIMSGGRSGTQVNLKLSATSNPTYVQFRKADTEELVASAFVHPGKTVTMHVPKGKYYIYFCSGQYWSGEENMFGSTGRYSRSEEYEVKSNQYVHTLTLESVPDGEVDVYGTDPANFRKK